MIPLCVPELAGNEWRYVKECLDSNWLSSAGAYVERFEAAFAAHLGTAHAVAMMNGTSALHAALLAVGVGPGDEVLVSDLTFIAPANAVRYAGAEPVFVDAEPATWQMDPALVAEFLQEDCAPGEGGLYNKASGRRIGAVLPVHILGHPADMDAICAAAAVHDVPVIEDAAEALGARYRGRPMGALGDAACFSFNGNKLITTGGGGMVVTGDAGLAERLRYLTTQAKCDPEEGVHGEVGYNYRLTSVQAALGMAQLERLEALVAAKRRIARRYNAALADLPGLVPMQEAAWAESAYWLYTVRVDPGLDRRRLRRRLNEAGVDVRPYWQPMHLSPAHVGAACLGGAVAEALYGELMSLPSSCGLGEAEQTRVIEALTAAVER
jgi:perosamine synthetase